MSVNDFGFKAALTEAVAILFIRDGKTKMEIMGGLVAASNSLGNYVQ
jgi:hypothetical protein